MLNSPLRALNVSDSKRYLIRCMNDNCTDSGDVRFISLRRTAGENKSVCGAVYRDPGRNRRRAGWSDLGEPRRFIEALTENGVENPWALADTCRRCGLKREQLIALSRPGNSKIAYEEELTSTCLS